MTAPIRNMAEIRGALVLAKIERGVSFETVDAIAGLPDRYTSKVLAPNPVKMVGNQSLGEIMQALGKMLVMVDDPDAIERVKGRWRKAKRPHQAEPPATFSIAEVLAAKAQITARQQNTGDRPSPGTSLSIGNRMQELRKMVKRESLVKAGKNGAKRRMKTMSRRARQQQASHAARKRWARQAATT